MSNFVQNYEIKVDRQLFSILAGLAVFLIIYVFGRIADAVKAKVDKPKQPAAMPKQRVAMPKAHVAEPARRKETAPTAKPCPAAASQAPKPKAANGNMTLRQAIVWGEILKRKY